MELYTIRRRRGWGTAEEVEVAAKRSREVGDDEMAGEVRWIRSYVVEEDDGTLGTLCIYQATGPSALRDHARRAGLPCDEIQKVVDTVLVRPDPD